MTIDIESIRNDFPALDQKVHGNQLVYFDNAASTLKCQSVIDAISQHYSKETANIHRGVHFLSEQGTIKYEETRLLIQQFINAKHEHEIILTKGTTDSINLVAHSFCQQFLKKGDEILLSEMEHHSNIVPWQLAAEKHGAKVVAAPVDDNGDLIVDEWKKLLNSKTKLIAICHISNTLGTINPIKELISAAHAIGAKTLIDGAQAIAHTEVDVQDLDTDFYCFSSHKLFGPTGVGVLYGKEEILNSIPPYQGGGDMIDEVTFEKTTYNDLPHKFEAGTPHIAGVIAFKAAIEYVQKIGLKNIEEYEHELLEYATEKFLKIGGLRIIGTAKKKASVISFVIEGAHPQDIGTLLDRQGIAVRTGHHCTQPLMKRFGVPATARASFSFYNTKEEIDQLVSGIEKLKEFL
jgi:cysteine desulfurase/selenocysteine lyase